jgi:mono/diheme cytochrome c family protein
VTVPLRSLAAALLAVAVVALRAPGSSAAQGAPSLALRAGGDSLRTTLDGVYTLAQANSGRDLFAGACKECHSNNVYAGQPLRQRWDGRTLGELFGYLRREMPKSNPGSLSDDDYALVIAYLLRLNEMPTGRAQLVGDSASLHGIKFAAPRPASPTPDLR